MDISTDGDTGAGVDAGSLTDAIEKVRIAAQQGVALMSVRQLARSLVIVGDADRIWLIDVRELRAALVMVRGTYTDKFRRRPDEAVDVVYEYRVDVERPGLALVNGEGAEWVLPCKLEFMKAATDAITLGQLP